MISMSFKSILGNTYKKIYKNNDYCSRRLDGKIFSRMVSERKVSF